MIGVFGEHLEKEKATPVGTHGDDELCYDVLRNLLQGHWFAICVCDGSARCFV